VPQGLDPNGPTLSRPAVKLTTNDLHVIIPHPDEIRFAYVGAGLQPGEPTGNEYSKLAATPA